MENNQLIGWVFAIIFYGVSDLLTTIIGLQFNVITEAGPIARPFYLEYGAIVFIPYKIIFFVIIYFIWKILPDKYAFIVPYAIGVGGILVCTWNIIMIAFVFL